VLVGSGCGGAGEAEPAGGERSARDARALVEHLEAMHPEPYHDVSRARLRAAADGLAARAAGLDDDELLVGLMRLAALPGRADGHTGIFPLDESHRRQLHLLPLRLYRFPEGWFVVGQVGGEDLVGGRVVAVGGRPVADVAALVAPLVPADNAWSRRARVAQWLVVVEVLRGLGLEPLVEVERDGRRVEVGPDGVPAQAWRVAFPDLFHPMVPQGLPRRDSPPWLARREEPWWTAELAGGRVAYGALNVTLGDVGAFAEELDELASRRGVDTLVLDLRHNPGGDNFTYPPLLELLQRHDGERRLVVLIGRTTFSAAGNLVAEVEATTSARFVGEPSGASPTQWGDAAPVTLPASGWSFHAATRFWPKAGPGDRRPALVPHEHVQLAAADFLAGRDPVLEHVLRPR